MIATLQTLYRWLLHLYPADFRTTYAAEMQEVFTLTLLDAAARPGHALLIWLRELRDIPLQALREHRRTRQPRLTLSSSFELTASRWLVRVVALLIWLIYFNGFYSPADTTPTLVSILALLGSLLIAWRWERIGGLLTIGISLSFGVILLLEASILIIFFNPILQPLSTLTFAGIAGLIALGFPAPFIIFGWFFYHISQQAKAVNQA